MAKRSKQSQDSKSYIPEGLARLTVQIPSDIKAALEVAGGRLGLSPGQVLVQLIKEHLAEDLEYVRRRRSEA